MPLNLSFLTTLSEYKGIYMMLPALLFISDYYFGSL